MGVLDEARRLMRDQFSNDEKISGRPQDKIRDLSQSLQSLTPDERKKVIEHVKAYADYYFVGHHREAVPAPVVASLGKLQRDSDRLEVVDRAREVLQRYGGPPTRETLAAALERSARHHNRGAAVENAVAQKQAVQEQLEQKKSAKKAVEHEEAKSRKRDAAELGIGIGVGS